MNTRIFNKHIFVWLASVIFGTIGADRFMRGQIGIGIVKLITLGGFGIWWLADAAIAIYKAYEIADNNLMFIDGRYA